MLMYNYLFLSETYESVTRDTCPSPNQAGFLVYSFKIFVIFIWNYHYSTQWCNNVAPVTNLCLGRATTRSHS